MRSPYLVLLDEADECGTLDFNGLTCSVVQGDDEMKEV
jgi:hypothetical protein